MSENSLMQDLLDETICLAAEEGASKEFGRFLLFIQEMLPFEILDHLSVLSGCDDAKTLLEDIWAEKFGEMQTTSSPDEDDFLINSCEICCREVRLTRHHVIPRETHKSMLKKGITKEHLDMTIGICRMCHSTIHRFFSNQELAEHYYSVNLLLADEKFLKYAKWASKQGNSRSNRVR